MLSQKYQDRLDKWMKNTLPVPSAEKVRGPHPKCYIPRRDYGDALPEFEKKQEPKK